MCRLIADRDRFVFVCSGEARAGGLRALAPRAGWHARTMPKFFCDYCGVHLTHDSFKGRKQHIYGAKHRQLYYAHYMRMADDLESQGIIVAANGAGSEAPASSGVRGLAFRLFSPETANLLLAVSATERLRRAAF